MFGADREGHVAGDRSEKTFFGFADLQPVFARQGVGCMNWGLVAGKTNTIYAWKEVVDPASLLDPHAEPELWFHDLFRPDGTPYDETEGELFKRYTATRSVRASDVAFPELALS